jgi:chromosome segregation ATPase
MDPNLKLPKDEFVYWKLSHGKFEKYWINNVIGVPFCNLKSNLPQKKFNEILDKFSLFRKQRVYFRNKLGSLNEKSIKLIDTIYEELKNENASLKSELKKIKDDALIESNKISKNAETTNMNEEHIKLQEKMQKTIDMNEEHIKLKEKMQKTIDDLKNRETIIILESKKKYRSITNQLKSIETKNELLKAKLSVFETLKNEKKQIEKIDSLIDLSSSIKNGISLLEKELLQTKSELARITKINNENQNEKIELLNKLYSELKSESMSKIKELTDNVNKNMSQLLKNEENILKIVSNISNEHSQSVNKIFSLLFIIVAILVFVVFGINNIQKN